MEHQTNILYHGSEGFVMTCCGCGRYQVAYGTCQFHIHEDMLRGLLHDLEQDERHCAERVDHRVKCFAYEVGSDHMRMILNYEEVCRLRNILSEAFWMADIMTEAGRSAS